MRRFCVAAVLALAMCLFLAGPGGSRPMSSAYARRQLQAIVIRQFSKAGSWAVRRAFCIVNRESSWNPRAISSTGDYGLFQINYSAHHRSYDWSRILDPRYNTAVAWRLSSGGRDWQPWAGGRYAC